MKNVRELSLGELIREAIFGYDAGSGPAARAELDRREREEYRRTGPSVAQMIEEKAAKKKSNDDHDSLVERCAQEIFENLNQRTCSWEDPSVDPDAQELYRRVAWSVIETVRKG